METGCFVNVGFGLLFSQFLICIEEISKHQQQEFSPINFHRAKKIQKATEQADIGIQ